MDPKFSGQDGEKCFMKQGEATLGVSWALVRFPCEMLWVALYFPRVNEVNWVNQHQFGTTKIPKGLEDFSQRRGCENWDSVETKGQRRMSSVCANSWWQRMKLRQPGCSQQCARAGQEGKGIREKRWNSLSKADKPFPEWGLSQSKRWWSSCAGRSKMELSKVLEIPLLLTMIVQKGMKQMHSRVPA